MAKTEKLSLTCFILSLNAEQHFNLTIVIEVFDDQMRQESAALEFPLELEMISVFSFSHQIFHSAVKPPQLLPLLV